jgi:hypothetical protein
MPNPSGANSQPNMPRPNSSVSNAAAGESSTPDWSSIARDSVVAVGLVIALTCVYSSDRDAVRAAPDAGEGTLLAEAATGGGLLARDPVSEEDGPGAGKSSKRNTKPIDGQDDPKPGEIELQLDADAGSEKTAPTIVVAKVAKVSESPGGDVTARPNGLPIAVATTSEQGPNPVVSDQPGLQPQPATNTQLAVEPEPDPLELTARAMPARGTLDVVVDRFIQYDIGQLRGSEGAQARNDFNRLQCEAIPALIRGFNTSTTLRASCPVIVIRSKLVSVMRQCNDLGMVELAMAQLGRGVPANAPYYRYIQQTVQQLVVLLPDDHPLRLRQTLVAELAGSRDETRLRSALRSKNAIERWAAAKAAHTQGQRHGDLLIPLLDDDDAEVRDEAHSALVSLARSVDYGPEDSSDARERKQAVKLWNQWWQTQLNLAVPPAMFRLAASKVNGLLKSPDAKARWAAVLVAKERGMGFQTDVIELVRDVDPSVRHMARLYLVDQTDGADFGPVEDETAAEEVYLKWKTWQSRNRLMPRFRRYKEDRLIDGFADEDTDNRWVAIAVAHRRKLDVPDAFIAVLSDSEVDVRQEARHALVDLSGGSDFGPSENADDAQIEEAVDAWRTWANRTKLLPEFRKRNAADLLAALKLDDANTRWAAATVAGERNLAINDDLLSMLNDEDANVRQACRQSLLNLSGGLDFGPFQEGDVEQALAVWQLWQQRRSQLGEAPADSEEIVEQLRSEDANQRWSAVVHARSLRMHCAEALIGLLTDADPLIQQEARAGLVALAAAGENFGPQYPASAEDAQASVDRWTDWLESREKRASTVLQLAEQVLDRNARSDVARKRLESIVDQFAGTIAAAHAQVLLAN